MTTKAKPNAVTINREQGLFVIPCGGGYSCLGFQVCARRSAKLREELGVPLPALPKVDSLEAYHHYRELVELARERHQKTGWRSSSELTPELIPHEGHRVEVVHRLEKTGDTERTRFIVGKSTGFIPCHLEIKTRRSSGGCAVALGEILSVRRV